MRSTTVAELPHRGVGKLGLRSVELSGVSASCAWPRETIPADRRLRLAGSLGTGPGDTSLGLVGPAAGLASGSSSRQATASGWPGRWLVVSMLALGVLAVAAAVVSYEAQYHMVFAAKNVAAVAALEAAIPDVAALVFATLGIALALHGKRAIRARVLNVAAVATSVTMNVLAAGAGWKDLAIWAMPPVAYALASDTE